MSLLNILLQARGRGFPPMLFLSEIQFIVFIITILLLIIDYRKKKVTLKKWLWWSITPFILNFIPFSYFLYELFGYGVFNPLYYLLPLVQLAVFIVYLIKRGKSPKKMVFYDVPATCPHCKNPNTKKSQECEWCGNKIY